MYLNWNSVNYFYPRARFISSRDERKRNLFTVLLFYVTCFGHLLHDFMGILLLLKFWFLIVLFEIPVPNCMHRNWLIFNVNVRCFCFRYYFYIESWKRCHPWNGKKNNFGNLFVAFGKMNKNKLISNRLNVLMFVAWLQMQISYDKIGKSFLFCWIDFVYCSVELYIVLVFVLGSISFRFFTLMNYFLFSRFNGSEWKTHSAYALRIEASFRINSKAT